VILLKSDAASERAELISKSLKRYRLVFVQIGAIFDPIRAEICANLGGIAVGIDQRHDWLRLSETAQALIVTDLERCSDSNVNVLGEVREIVASLLDSEKTICLISRAPRLAFASVPGSSILEDVALVTLPLLGATDIKLEEDERAPSGWLWPSISSGSTLSVDSFLGVFDEMGQGLSAALDHALFEVDPKGTSGLKFLSAREIEGLRGSGIIQIDSAGRPTLTHRSAAKLLREALAAHVSDTVSPASILTEVTAGLWYVERRIRSALRTSAIAKYPTDWRTSSIGGLKDEVLRRAQLDTNVVAKSVNDLRDPLEWLTLGELMEIVRGSKFDNLGIEPVIWRKLQEQLVPVRNRLAHVRMLKAQDAEIVTMWANVVRTRFMI
jgi:hypothetical protein